MDNFTPITSANNKKVAWLRGLHKSAVRRDEGLFLVEGSKEISWALKGEFKPHSLFVREDNFDLELAQKFNEVPIYSLSKKAFERVAYRDAMPDGLLAIFHTPSLNLDSIKLSKNPFIIIVEALEKPGNLGAILRIADGCSADAVIVADEHTDIFNPNVVRSSVGTIFTKQIAVGSNEQVLEFCRKNNLELYAAALKESSLPYAQVNFKRPCAIVVGTEATGLTNFWLQNGQAIIIPMLGQNDSLNVSAATAVLAYEVLRQRS